MSEEMHQKGITNIADFFIVGINYKKTDASTRGLFSVNNDQYEQIIAEAPIFGVSQLFVLSTCNRTEIYGFAQHSAELAMLLCNHTEGCVADFIEKSYVRSGEQAIEHLFHVASGLDSQILGDYEIVGQIKKSAKFSKERNFIGAYLERIINEVLQASKKIRTNTGLSSGTVSVSFAAVQFIRNQFGSCTDKEILLLGTGKIGSSTCKNIADYLPAASVTLMNRHADKACRLADAFNFSCEEIDQLQSCMERADIIIIATNADEPLIHRADLAHLNRKLIIDLSLPCNVAEDVKTLSHIQLVNVDELSKIKDETLVKRSAEIPKVKMIIAEHMREFLSWHEMRKHVPLLKNVKSKLLTLQSDAIFDSSQSALCSSFNNKASGDKIQKVIDGMAVKLRLQHQPGCHYIEAINDFISTGTVQ